MGEEKTIPLDEAKVCKDCRSIFTGQRCPCGSASWFSVKAPIGDKLARHGRGFETTEQIPWMRRAV